MDGGGEDDKAVKSVPKRLEDGKKNDELWSWVKEKLKFLSKKLRNTQILNSEGSDIDIYQNIDLVRSQHINEAKQENEPDSIVVNSFAEYKNMNNELPVIDNKANNGSTALPYIASKGLEQKEGEVVASDEQPLFVSGESKNEGDIPLGPSPMLGSSTALLDKVSEDSGHKTTDRHPVDTVPAPEDGENLEKSRNRHVSDEPHNELDTEAKASSGDEMREIIRLLRKFQRQLSEQKEATNVNLLDQSLSKKETEMPESPSSSPQDDYYIEGTEYFIKSEKARALAARSKYYEATSLLEEIESTEEITELGIKLLMAECYLQLGRENKANKSIRGLRSVLLKNPTLDADEALGLVESLVENKSYTRALIMLPVVSELFQRLSSADDILEGLFRCIKKANDCTRPMISSGGRDRILALDFGMDYMVDTLKDLEGLNADPQKKAFKQCLATTLIAYDYWMLKENLKGVRLRERAVAAMDRAFGEAAKQRRIYGNSLYNIGVGYDILSKPNEAKAAYLKAIEAIELATDFDDESDRRRDLKMCQQKMKELYK